MIAIPSLDRAIVTCAELRITDAPTWAAALISITGPMNPSQLRLTMTELAEFFLAATHTATELLPSLITPDPRTALWTSPPQIELRLTTERPFGPDTSPPDLTNLMDFDAFGERTTTGPLTAMTVTITAPPTLTDNTRQDVVCGALTYMAHRFGFSSATPDTL